MGGTLRSLGCLHRASAPVHDLLGRQELRRRRRDVSCCAICFWSGCFSVGGKSAEMSAGDVMKTLVDTARGRAFGGTVGTVDVFSAVLQAAATRCSECSEEPEASVVPSALLTGPTINVGKVRASGELQSKSVHGVSLPLMPIRGPHGSLGTITGRIRYLPGVLFRDLGLVRLLLQHGQRILRFFFSQHVSSPVLAAGIARAAFAVLHRRATIFTRPTTSLRVDGVPCGGCARYVPIRRGASSWRAEPRNRAARVAYSL